MLEDYAKQNGYTNIEHFTDDGYSGGSFDRLDWKRILAKRGLGTCRSNNNTATPLTSRRLTL